MRALQLWNSWRDPARLDRGRVSVQSTTTSEIFMQTAPGLANGEKCIPRMCIYVYYMCTYIYIYIHTIYISAFVRGGRRERERETDYTSRYKIDADPDWWI